MQSYDDNDGLIWFDGAMVPWKDTKVHVLTHGLHYASAVFEGQRSYNGQIFKLEEHTERLIHSATTLGFELPFSAKELNAANYKVLKANNILDGYLRPVAWRGSEMMGVSAQECSIHVAIAAWEWPSYFTPEARLKGIRLQWSKWKRPSPETIPAKTKAAGLYMICTLSKHDAEANGFDDALMLDWRGRIAEATGANIFLVIDDKLHTPIADCFLDGITRQTVIHLAKARGIETVERIIMPDDLSKATEVFVTGTAAEVTPVSQIGEDLQFQVGSITQQLIEDYTSLTNGHA
ncbi:MAG: branched-chain amino acid aminotransferase [Rhodospirillaceae bacterium]|nr:branched-chain amino acid aminotransferase [Rhodospirillaceae bacterium]|tara:strand:+ start:181 stop:1056 length:876 start_codon:yes stop_codon:yes gene_type:complete